MYAEKVTWGNFFYQQGNVSLLGFIPRQIFLGQRIASVVVMASASVRLFSSGTFGPLCRQVAVSNNKNGEFTTHCVYV